MEQTKKLNLPPVWLAKLQKRFRSARVPDDSMCTTLRRIYREHQYLVDPHTAVALHTAQQLRYDDVSSGRSGDHHTPVAILSTASPCKFEKAVTLAIGQEAWHMYVSSSEDFPKTAMTVLAKEEVPPIQYRAEATLEESQIVWEGRTREILSELEKLS